MIHSQRTRPVKTHRCVARWTPASTLTVRPFTAVFALGALAAIATSATAQTPPAAPAPLTGGWQDGFILQTANGDYRLTLGMTAQADGRFSLDTPAPFTDTFTLRKIRPTFTGRIAKYFDYKVMPDLGGGQVVMQDAYLDARFSPKFRVRMGKDKTPVGYELLIGDAYVLFPERSIATSLIPNRDNGVQVQGDLFANKLSYSAGVFNGIPDGTSSSTEVDANNLSCLLAPRTIAVVGASRTAGSIGHQILANLLAQGFTGAVYPVNPQAHAILRHDDDGHVERIGDEGHRRIRAHRADRVRLKIHRYTAPVEPCARRVARIW